MPVRTKPLVAIAALVVALMGLTACSAPTATPAPTGGTPSAGATSTGKPAGPSEPRKSKMVGKLGKTELFLHTTKTYDPAKFPKTSMDGEPSDIPFFKPVKDEGKIDRDYPDYDAKTFKFLALPAGTLPPQSYYMFDKDGGSLKKALAGTGYKAVEIIDQGHIKILPNLYVGYYDFAWVPLNVLAEYWSGNESMSQELWRDGDDYVVIGNGWNGGISLMAPEGVTEISQLDGEKVGIMNPSFNIETLFQKKLKDEGLSTAASGGTVDIEMGTPGFIMNDLMAKKLKAVFAWGTYAQELKKLGYREIVPWTEMGYGKKVPYEVLVVRRDILEKHPEIVQKVVQANYDATKQALSVGDYKAPLVEKYNAFKGKYMGQPATPLASPANLVDPDAQASPVFLKDVVSYMTSVGYFAKPYTYGRLVDESFYNKVKK